METGQKYKEEILKLKQQLKGSQHLGTYQGDRFIEEAENDPSMMMREPSPDSKGEVEPLAQASYGRSKLNELFQMMQKSQNRTDQIILDFEKNFGLRL